MKIHEWIIENLDLANSFGARGHVPVDLQDTSLTFQIVDYPVEYRLSDSGKTLMRLDHISKTVDPIPLARWKEEGQK